MRMKILTILPIAKGIPRDELSYFSAKEVRLGTFVTVPFGKRTIQGIVIDANEVRDLKSSIKTSDFALRNVTTVHTDRELPSGMFQAAQNTARFYTGRPGNILEIMIPRQAFDHYLSHAITAPKTDRMHADIQAMQIPLRDRISYYKTFIRENFAKNVSTMIIAPTVVQAEQIYKSVMSGIEDRIVIAHSKKTKKHIEKVIAQVVEQKDPVVMVATAPFVSLIRSDWSTVIIEESSSSHYRYGFSMSFDLRFFVEQMAKWYGARLVYADTLLSSDIRYRIGRSEMLDMRSTWHIAKPESFKVIDTKTPAEIVQPRKIGKELTVARPPFKMISPELHAMIEKATSEKSQVLLLTTRKGIAPLTTCADCGTTVTCPVCQTPLVLHHKKSKDPADQARIYMCHHCMHTTTPQDRCASCGGWRLTMLGISTEGIRAEIEERFPNAKTFICDGDVTATPAAIAKTVQAWKETPGAIMIATPMAVPHIDQTDYGCIVSMDSLLSLPAYTSGEHALATALTFLERIERGALLQTRNFSHEVVQAIETENVFDFMRNEIESRTQFGYPPAKVLLKISHEVSKHEAKEVSEYFETVFRPYDPDILMKRSRLPDRIIVEAVLKVEPAIWNDFNHDLHVILAGLSPSFKKEVNPESVL